MNAPQIIFIAFIVGVIVSAAHDDGKQRTISFGKTLFAAACWVSILYFGGFFTDSNC